MYIQRLTSAHTFPDPAKAPPEGILAFGGDLSSSRLLQAYSKGIFPWYSRGEPILWWSPDPRLVLYPDSFRCTKSLQKSIRNRGYAPGIDTAFESVINECANIRERAGVGTWIVDDIKRAYSRLHHLGFAHSFEIFDSSGELVGGLYGVSLGGGFFGESMFAKSRDASKVALFYLCEFCKKHRFDFIDAQVGSAHLKSLGAELIPRERFLKELEETLKKPTIEQSWNTL